MKPIIVFGVLAILVIAIANKSARRVVWVVAIIAICVLAYHQITFEYPLIPSKP